WRQHMKERYVFMKYRFVLHDVARFPIVIFRSELAQGGFAAAWMREMDALLEGGQPFVIISDAPSRTEDHEDFRARGVWLKANKDKLAIYCKALIHIEPDAERREALSAMVVGFARAFGVAQLVAGDEATAEHLATSVLSAVIP
ncbi:MAG: hypothetical protein KGI75_29090, partial [Rhizobiaceae bacterium]|nr:hypothetical protein [Rhizobiaceae bacterium]